MCQCAEAIHLPTVHTLCRVLCLLKHHSELQRPHGKGHLFLPTMDSTRFFSAPLPSASTLTEVQPESNITRIEPNKRKIARPWVISGGSIRSRFNPSLTIAL